MIGPTALAGRDRDAHAHRWAIWRGRTGLLVLQQSSYDPQFGIDINYWLHPWKDGDPRPDSPFIDWLFGVSAAAPASLAEPGVAPDRHPVSRWVVQGIGAGGGR